MSRFLSINLAGLREWDDIFKMMKEKNYQSRVVHSVKLLFENVGEIKFSQIKKKGVNYP